MKKFLLTILLAIAFVTLQSGCNHDSADNSKGKAAGHVIAVIPKGTTHIFWQSVKNGAETAGREFGCDIRWNGPEREGDRERQIQIVEDFIVQKVDGLVIAPLDNKALVPSVEKLAAVKIPCVIIDSGIETEKYTTFAATDNYKGGVLAGRKMGEILGGKGNVLLLKYAVGSASTEARENGFSDTIQKEFPGIKIVDSKYGQDTVETALQAAEDLLTRNKDVQGWFACNESTAIAAMQALQGQKRTEIKFIGFDASKALLAGLRAGQIQALVVQNPFKMGYEGVKAIAMTLKGETVPKKIDTGVEIITTESLNDAKIQDLLKNNGLQKF